MALGVHISLLFIHDFELSSTIYLSFTQTVSRDPLKFVISFAVQDCPFSVRGPTYLKDKKKVPAGIAAFTFGALDIFSIPEPIPHIARFLPSVRYDAQEQAMYSFPTRECPAQAMYSFPTRACPAPQARYSFLTRVYPAPQAAGKQVSR
jgi:hypothetical protein